MAVRRGRVRQAASPAPRKAKPPLEKAVEKAVIKLFTLYKCEVYKLSQPRHTMQTPGIPDLLVFGPRNDAGHRQVSWFEVKRPGGKLREAQFIFRELCDQSYPMSYRWGGTQDALDMLKDWGLIR